MAQYYTDFSEYASDVPPTGWTSPFAGDDTFLVVDSVVGGVTGGKVLILENGYTPLTSTTWSALGVLSGDVEVLGKVRSTNAFSAHPYVIGRNWNNGSGVTVHADPTSNRRYEGVWRFNADGFVQIRKTDSSGTLTVLSTFNAAAPKWAPDTEWSFFRLRREGTTLKHSWWRDGETEPATWQNITTDSDFDSGEEGIISTRGGRGVAADFFSVGTAGDSAPSGPVATGPETPINPSVTNLLATSARLTWEQG